MYPKIRHISDYMKDDRCINTIEKLLNLTDETTLKIKCVEIYGYYPSKYNYVDILNKILLCKKLKIYMCYNGPDFSKYISLFPSLLYLNDHYKIYNSDDCYVLQNNVLTIVTDLSCLKIKCLDYNHCIKCFVKYKMNTLYYKYVNLQIYGRHVYIINSLNLNVECITFATNHKQNLGCNFSFNLKKLRIVCFNTSKKNIKYHLAQNGLYIDVGHKN